MVHFVRSLISVAALISVSSAAPMPKPDGSAIGAEEPVSAPNGTPTSDPLPSATSGGSGYGSSGGSGGYGGSSDSSMAGYGGSGGYSSASSMMDESTMMSEEMSSTMMSEMSSATESAWMSSETVATYTSSASYAMNTYGSGSSSWGGSGYDSCVQQCAASFGQPSATWTPSATETGSSSGGSGVTHTIIVAPSQGVLRYIPFSTNASVGDTVSFQWGAGPHVVSQSSALEVCNKTGAPTFFTSGLQNKSFVFNKVINDTKPIWFYCSVPGHCQKGMFGGVNIGQADPTGSDTFGNSSSGSSSDSSSGYMSMSQAMENMTMTGDMSAMWSYTKSKTASNAYANNWGMSTNMYGMNSDAMMQTMENVMYMQTLIAANPSSVQNGKFAVSNAANMTIPLDLKQALAAAPSNSSSAPASSTSAASGAAGAAASASSASPSPSPSNGAGSIASSSIAVGLVAVVATFFAL